MATVAASPRVVEVPGSMNPGLVNPSVTHILDLDSFPVGTVVRAIRYSEMIAFAVVYGLYFLLLLFRLICHTRPRHTHRRGAYVCFVFMAICTCPFKCQNGLSLWKTWMACTMGNLVPTRWTLLPVVDV